MPLPAVRTDNATARRLAATGATLLLRGVPEGAEIALDMAEFNAGPRFAGVKMVPLGPHVLATRAPAEGGPGAGRDWSVFVADKPGQVVVRHWDAEAGRLRPGPGCDADQEARLAAGVRRWDFDAGLGPCVGPRF